MMSWLDNFEWSILLIGGGLLMFTPFFPEPHLFEKIRMLSQGVLTKPIDIFDLFMHSSPIFVIALKAYRQFVLKVNR